MKISLALTILMLGLAANAKEKSGNVSFGGIQVRVRIDAQKRFFQIGESKFDSSNEYVDGTIFMTGRKRVGVNSRDETLEATIYLKGPGLNSSGYKCTDVRVRITRTADDGKETVLKDECAFIN